MTTVKLYGFLRMRYGREFQLAVSSPGEAVRALASQFPDFRKYLMSHRLGYHIFVDKRNIGEEELQLNRQAKVIKFVPAVAGAKAGVLQTIIGVVLIVASFVAPLIGLGALSPYLLSAGISMTLGGVITMLTSHPKSKTAQEDGSTTSYSFNGPTNTTAQGHPVPVGYGYAEVGAAVISAAITIGAAVSGSNNAVAATPADGTTEVDPGPSGDNNTVVQASGDVMFGTEGGG